MTDIGAHHFPPTVAYFKEHTWVRVDGDLAVVGISDYAQARLGEIIFIDLPQPGDRFDQDEAFGVVESAKAASDLYMPVTGEIAAVNELLIDSPETVNSSPFEDGWMIKVKAEDPTQIEALMNSDDYLNMLKA